MSGLDDAHLGGSAGGHPFVGVRAVPPPRRPVQVTWRERTAVVADVLEYWVQARVWWLDPEPEVKRDYWWWRVRLVAESGSLIVDLREDEGTWTVEHLLD
ncbi:DUF6504 family protein [Nonomuraea sp. NPDC050663]|uniref:DUF6504 family protein n=1 Tax=Nonomuraea sp. NPDC050663 TaxID=3364370 RepID=UPI0037B52772